MKAKASLYLLAFFLLVPGQVFAIKTDDCADAIRASYYRALPFPMAKLRRFSESSFEEVESVLAREGILVARVVPEGTAWKISVAGVDAVAPETLALHNYLEEKFAGERMYGFIKHMWDGQALFRHHPCPDGKDDALLFRPYFDRDLIVVRVDRGDPKATILHEYIHILNQDLSGDGQLRPYEGQLVTRYHSQLLEGQDIALGRERIARRWPEGISTDHPDFERDFIEDFRFRIEELQLTIQIRFDLVLEELDTHHLQWIYENGLNLSEEERSRSAEFYGRASLFHIQKFSELWKAYVIDQRSDFLERWKLAQTLGREGELIEAIAKLESLRVRMLALHSMVAEAFGMALRTEGRPLMEPLLPPQE